MSEAKATDAKATDASTPFVAYVGPKLGDAMGCDKWGDGSRRELRDFNGTRIGTCFLSKSWPVRSFIGSRMWQIYAIVDGVDYTGRGFGEGMSVNLRLCKGALKGRK